MNYILYVDQSVATKNLPSETDSNKTSPSPVKPLLEAKSDLVPGVYEGGFKIWECTYDLLSYLQENSVASCLPKARVLDLGCGAGLTGIFCALLGATSVTFQDYNADVINGVTIPNYCANNRNQNKLKCKPNFFSGPWNKFCDSIKQYQNSYDLILTSETIYNTSHYETIIDIFDFCLSPSGVILLAAKVNYFGVGGGLRQFEDSLNSRNNQRPRWSYKTVKVHGDHVKREVLEIKRKL